MRVRLVLTDRELQITRSDTVIGRAPECDIILPEKSISRAHAAIHLDANARVRDLGSRNGTWLNGARLLGDRKLRTGDKLAFGLVEAKVYCEGVQVHDDGWLALQSAMLVKASIAMRTRDADEIVFRLAEGLESRITLREPIGADVADAALAAVIDYATLRERQGWVRWALALHAKLVLAPGPAVRRALESSPPDSVTRIRPSGVTTTKSIVPSRRRTVG